MTELANTILTVVSSDPIDNVLALQEWLNEGGNGVEFMSEGDKAKVAKALELIEIYSQA